MTTTPSTTAPLADAPVLALAQAIHGVLRHVLARHGVTFRQQVVLRAAVTADAPQTPDEILTRIRRSLRVDPADIRATVGELLAKQLLTEDGAHLLPTDAGRELLAAVGAETAPIAAHILASTPAEDLAAAGRVLALVTERADAQPAGLTA
ncbi:MarR family transcriptional regulator [Kitasatospora sp. NPDC047058]|uniref:MarR family transcriptional regulator n=1 Tax=Kitasatospora sp. NPDC047058 TaxID=3155620 RepID=UPI0033DD53AB